MYVFDTVSKIVGLHQAYVVPGGKLHASSTVQSPFQTDPDLAVGLVHHGCTKSYSSRKSGPIQASLPRTKPRPSQAQLIGGISSLQLRSGEASARLCADSRCSRLSRSGLAWHASQERRVKLARSRHTSLLTADSRFPEKGVPASPCPPIANVARVAVRVGSKARA